MPGKSCPGSNSYRSKRARPSVSVVAAHNEFTKRPKHDFATIDDRETSCKAQAGFPLVRRLLDDGGARAALLRHHREFPGGIKGRDTPPPLGVALAFKIMLPAEVFLKLPRFAVSPAGDRQPG